MAPPTENAAARADARKEARLSVNGLVTQVSTEEGVVTAVDGLSFERGQGETLGIVGESETHERARRPP